MIIKKLLPTIFISVAIIIFSIILAFFELPKIGTILIFIAIVLLVISNGLILLKILSNK